MTRRVLIPTPPHPFQVTLSLLSILSPPFCRLSVVSQKLLIYKLLCQSLSQKLSFSQGFSVLAICLSSGSISFIGNFLLIFFFFFWLRVREVLKTSRRKGKVCSESSALYQSGTSRTGASAAASLSKRGEFKRTSNMWRRRPPAIVIMFQLV